jgi:hypothetical protein
MSMSKDVSNYKNVIELLHDYKSGYILFAIGVVCAPYIYVKYREFSSEKPCVKDILEKTELKDYNNKTIDKLARKALMVSILSGSMAFGLTSAIMTSSVIYRGIKPDYNGILFSSSICGFVTFTTAFANCGLYTMSYISIKELMKKIDIYLGKTDESTESDEITPTH